MVTQLPDRCRLSWLQIVLRRFLRRTTPAQYFSGIVVHPVLEDRYLFFCNAGKIGPLGIPPPDYAVVILVGPLLPGGVAVTIVNVEPVSAMDGGPQFLVPQEL